jgi:hypothetical protein
MHWPLLCWFFLFVFCHNLVRIRWLRGVCVLPKSLLLAESSAKGNELGDEGVEALATALLVSVFACILSTSCVYEVVTAMFVCCRSPRWPLS